MAKTIKQRKICLFFATIYAFVWSIGKILFGAFTGAYFFCVGGASTLLFAFVKKIYLKHFSNENEQKKRIKAINIAILILCSSALFIFYMARLFYIEDAQEYGLIWSIAIATFSFVELGLAIFNFSRARRTNDVLLQSFRGCSLASSCFAMVLTQVALLSATETPANFYNALSGCIFGGIALLIGVYLLIKTIKQRPKQVESQP